jgi:hypothetical protein
MAQAKAKLSRARVRRKPKFRDPDHYTRTCTFLIGIAVEVVVGTLRHLDGERQRDAFLNNVVVVAGKHLQASYRAVQAAKRRAAR